MSDDLTTDNEAENDAEEEKPKPPARSDNRFKDLSEKVETTAKERDEATAAKLAAEKELDFYKGFSKVSSKPEYQSASEFQDKIKEKVLSGYDMEDATISVLGKAGRLGNFTPQQRSSPAGGSATNAIQSGDEKAPGEMTTAEKRAALLEIERTEPGSLSHTLRTINKG